MEKKEGVFNFFYFVYNYGRYHNNSVNQLLHFVFIPIIQFTLFIIMAIKLHALKIDFLDNLVPEGIICPEMWGFALFVQVCYYRVDLLTAFLYSAWAFPQMVIA